MNINQAFIDRVVSAAVAKKNIVGVVLCVENSDNTISLLSSAGNIKHEQPYFIASVTKLFVTTTILQLRSKGKLSLDDRIADYLSKDILYQIHYFKGKDYSRDITIKHLMSNTSGIPDYFNREIITQLLLGNDQAWGFDRVINKAKQLQPTFAPGEKGNYSDTNYRLLGKIIEVVTGKDLETIWKESIFNELGLTNTSMYHETMNNPPINIYYKTKQLHLPKYLSSIGPEGGIVSTAKDMMIFLKAFFNGHFFPNEYIQELAEWKLLFNPGLFYYGVGISRQPLSLRELQGGLYGHWGQSGAFAFYHPPTDLYFTGTVNQFIGHAQAVKMMTRIIKAVQ